MRKKKRAADRLCALSRLVVSDVLSLYENGGVFDAARPMRLEIGCGKGDFICAISMAQPEYNYIAMEKITDVITLAVEKYARGRSLGELDYHGGWRAPDGTVFRDGGIFDIPAELRGNVRFMPGDAALILPTFADGSFETVYVNFCDPWTKNGYTSRRLTHASFLSQYLRLLVPGGYFRFKTDNDELFAYSLETVGASDFELVFETCDLHSSELEKENIMTEYERAFSEKGVKINALIAKSPL